jgi:NodT family efflux transporter outer membrane factor (OMF) lipoprotein
MRPRAPRRSWLAGPLILSLCGCALGPRTFTPATPAPAAGAFVSAAAPATAADAPPPRWWRLYQDPVLDGLVDQALTQNQDLKVAAANLAYAQALLSEARAGRFPGTTLSGAAPSYGRSGTQIELGRGASDSYSAAFSAAYQVDLFGKVRRGIQAARADAEASLAAADLARVTVAGETASAYATLCGYAEQIAVARHSVELLRRTYDLTRAERDAGALSDFDLDRQAALLDQAKAAVPPLEGQRRAALFTLAALVGKAPAEVPARAAACQAPPTLTRPLPVGDGAALIRRRPDIRQSERQLRAATARIGVALADLYPSVTLGGSIGDGVLPVSSTTTYNAFTYSVGPLISWSFPNLLTARAHVREAGAQASAALASFDGVVLNALRDTETALSTYASELDHHRALLAAQTDAAEALRLADVQFRSGAASFLDLLSAESAVVAADQAVALSDQALTFDQVAVFQQLGGGWEDAPPVKTARISGR